MYIEEQLISCSSIDFIKIYNDLALNININDYINDNGGMVICLIRLTPINNSSCDIFTGSICLFRYNILKPNYCHTSYLFAGDPYNYDYRVSVNMMDLGNRVSAGNYYNITPCKFKYNDIWYGGVRILAPGSGLSVLIHGMHTKKEQFQPFAVAYKSYGNIINTEIEESLDIDQNSGWTYNDTSNQMIYNNLTTRYFTRDYYSSFMPGRQSTSLKWYRILTLPVNIFGILALNRGWNSRPGCQFLISLILYDNKAEASIMNKCLDNASHDQYRQIRLGYHSERSYYFIDAQIGPTTGSFDINDSYRYGLSLIYPAGGANSDSGFSAPQIIVDDTPSDDTILYTLNLLS